MKATLQKLFGRKRGSKAKGRERVGGPAGGEPAIRHQVVLLSHDVGLGEGLVQDLLGAGLGLRSVDHPGRALRELRIRPGPMLVDEMTPHSDDLVRHLRRDRSVAACPVIVGVRHVAEELVSKALSWGANDVAPIGEPMTVRRLLVAVAEGGIIELPEADSGTVLVACGDAALRKTYPSLLRIAGYGSTVVQDIDGLLALQGSDAPRFLILGGDLLLQRPALVDELTGRAGITVPTVVLAPAEKLDRLTTATRRRARVRVLPMGYPPEAVIATGRSLLTSQPEQLRRASERIVAPMILSFALRGGVSPIPGVVLDLSAEGVGVRTVAPPTVGTAVQLIVRPPGQQALLRLRAEVAWSRPFRAESAFTRPSGFGARLVRGDGRMLANWKQMHRKLMWQRYARMGQHERRLPPRPQARTG